MADEGSKFLTFVGLGAAVAALTVAAVFFGPIVFPILIGAAVFGLAAFFVGKAILDRPSAPTTAIKTVPETTPASAVTPSTAHQPGLTAQQSVNPQTIAQVAESRIKASGVANTTQVSNTDSEKREPIKPGK